MSLDSSKRIVYIGSDTSYRNNILDCFEAGYFDQEFEFYWLPIPDGGDCLELFNKLVDLNPSIIYVDFTECVESMLLLMKFVGKDNFFKSTPLVGLLENKAKVRSCIEAGIDFVFVKGGEIYDVIYSPMVLAFPEIAKRTEFARAEITRNVEIMDELRIVYVTKNYIQAEGDIVLKEGEVIELDIDIPINHNFLVKSVSSKNIHYNFKYSYRLDFIFVKKPEFDDSKHESILKERGNEKKKIKMIKEIKARHQIKMDVYRDKVWSAKKRHSEWIKDFSMPITEKKLKVMIVDKRMRILKDKRLKYLDKLPYLIYSQTCLSGDYNDVESIRPSVVVLEMMSEFNSKQDGELNLALEETGDGDTVESSDIVEKKTESELEWVSKFIKHVKSMGDYMPIIVLFKFNHGAKALRETYNYPMILTNEDHMSVDLITKLVNIYKRKLSTKRDGIIKVKIQDLKKKFPLKYRNLSYKNFIKLYYYVDKGNPAESGLYRSSVVVKSLTESEITFFSKEELPEKNIVIRLLFPMYIRIIPVEDGKLYINEGASKLYRALIHGVSEVDKKELRCYVNEVFLESSERGSVYGKIEDRAQFKTDVEIEDQLSLNRIDENPEPKIIAKWKDFSELEDGLDVKSG